MKYRGSNLVRWKELHVYVSPCCRVDCVGVRNPPIIKKTSPGCTSYYYSMCEKCETPCHPLLVKIYDSAGEEIKIGDIVECPETPADIAWHWHVACEEYGALTIRDLGHNNTGMYNLNPPYYTRGPYWRHLSLLEDSDLEHYFDTTREAALEMLKKES